MKSSVQGLDVVFSESSVKRLVDESQQTLHIDPLQTGVPAQTEDHQYTGTGHWTEGGQRSTHRCMGSPFLKSVPDPEVERQMERIRTSDS